MKNVAKSVFFVAGCAATATLFSSLGLSSPEHENPTPAHAAEGVKPKTVKATPKTTTAEESKPHGVQIETAEPKTEEHETKAPTKAVRSETKPETRTKSVSTATVETDTEVTADEAIARLQEGNGRWVSDQDSHPHTEGSRRELLADKGQKPFATILTCSDSRVPVEQIFDQGVGDVFTIRVAGNVAGISETGTIEYGAGHLHTPLLVVMGHTKCGAVGAAATNAPVHGMVAKLVGNIQPAVERVRRNNPGVDDKQLAVLSVKENVWQTVFDLYKNSDELRELVASGKLKVVGAVYDISTGKVDFLGEHPWQGELLGALKARTDTATADGEKH